RVELPIANPMNQLLLSLLFFGLTIPLRAQEIKSLADFQAAADQANEILTIPDWPKTPAEIGAEIYGALAKANTALDTIGQQDITQVSFQSTAGALDDMASDAYNALNKATIIKQTNKDAAMRDAAEAAIKTFQDWAVGIDYREDVYQAAKAFADKKAPLNGEDALLLEYTMRDYRRAGLDLPPEKRAEVERLRKEL